MRAVVIERAGGPEVLTIKELPSPEPKKGEVRVAVKAIGVNRADVMQRMGHYPAPADSPPDIPGLEYAGIVDAVGEGVNNLKLGDRVFGLAGGGTYAEHVVAHSLTTVKIPDYMDFSTAAAIPEVFITAYDALVCQCSFRSGQTVLIHAVGSGVGLAAVQIVRALGGFSIGTARSAEKVKEAHNWGMDKGIVVGEHSFAHKVNEMTAGKGVDIVIELVGGKYFHEDLQCIANLGQIIIVGLVAGTKSEIDLATVLRKRIVIHGTTMRMRPLDEKIQAANLLERNILPLFERGLLKANIDEQMPITDVVEAHRIIDSNKNFGKVVLTM